MRGNGQTFRHVRKTRLVIKLKRLHMENSISKELETARTLFNKGYAYHDDMRKMGYSVTLDGCVFYNSKFIGWV